MAGVILIDLFGLISALAYGALRMTLRSDKDGALKLIVEMLNLLLVWIMSTALLAIIQVLAMHGSISDTDWLGKIASLLLKGLEYIDHPTSILGFIITFLGAVSNVLFPGLALINMSEDQLL